MPYHRLLYHFVWATRDRMPLVDEAIRGTLYAGISTKAKELGALVHALDGTSDHVHMVVSLPPSVAPATFVGQVKGASSHLASHMGIAFAWQAEYGVLTISESGLPAVVAYVKEQQRHHDAGETRVQLET